MVDTEYLRLAYAGVEQDARGRGRSKSRSPRTRFIPITDNVPGTDGIVLEPHWLKTNYFLPQGEGEFKERDEGLHRDAWPCQGVPYTVSKDPRIEPPLAVRVNPKMNYSWVNDFGKLVDSPVMKDDSVPDFNFVRRFLFNDLPEDAFPGTSARSNLKAPAWCKDLQIVSIKKLRRAGLWRQHWECAVETAIRRRGKREVANVLQGSIVDDEFPVEEGELWNTHSEIMRMANRHWLWHGTSTTDPKIITEKGVDIRFAQEGGRFAQVS